MGFNKKQLQRQKKNRVLRDMEASSNSKTPFLLHTMIGTGLIILAFIVTSSVAGDYRDLSSIRPERPTVSYDTYSPMDNPGFPQDCERVPVVRLKEGCLSKRKECRHPDPAGGSLGCKEVCGRTTNKGGMDMLPVVIVPFENTFDCQDCDRHFKECFVKHCDWVRQNTCSEPLAPRISWKPVKTCTQTISRECALRIKDVCEAEGLKMQECARTVCNEDPVEHCTWNPVAVYHDHHEPLQCKNEGASLCKDQEALKRCVSRQPEGCGRQTRCQKFMQLVPSRLHSTSCKLKCKVEPVCSEVPDTDCYEVVLERQC